MDGTSICPSLSNSEESQFANDTIPPKMDSTIRKQTIPLQTDSKNKTKKKKFLWKGLPPSIKQESTQTIQPSKRKHEQRKESIEQHKQRKIEEAVTRSISYTEQGSYRPELKSYPQKNSENELSTTTATVYPSPKDVELPQLRIVPKAKGGFSWFNAESSESSSKMANAKNLFNDLQPLSGNGNENYQVVNDSSQLSLNVYDNPTEAISEAQEITRTISNSTNSTQNYRDFPTYIYHYENLIESMEIERRRYYQNSTSAKVDYAENDSEPYEINSIEKIGNNSDTKQKIDETNSCNNDFLDNSNKNEVNFECENDETDIYSVDSYNGMANKNNNGHPYPKNCEISANISNQETNSQCYSRPYTTAEYLEEAKNHVFPFKHSLNSSKRDISKISTFKFPSKSSDHLTSNLKSLAEFLDLRFETEAHQFSPEEKEAIKKIDSILLCKFYYRGFNIIMILLIVMIVLALTVITILYFLKKIPAEVELIHIMFFNLVALFVLFTVNSCASREVRTSGKYAVNSYFKIYWHLFRKKFDKKFADNYLFINDWYGDDKDKFIKEKLKEIAEIEKDAIFNSQSNEC